MFQNYFKTAFRYLIGHKLFTSLNIIGLATGLACSILILLWVRDELSYDRFNENAGHIYRVIATSGGQSVPLAGAPLAAAIKRSIPGVRNAARFRPNYGQPSIFTIGSRNFEEKNAIYADPEFLQIFSYPLIIGDPATALVQPDGLLLTERMARKYFGTENAIGKTIRMDNKDVFKVTGILRDIPTNSHLQFDILLPMSYDAHTDDDIINHHWDNLNFFTYLQFDDGKDMSPATLAAIGKQITAINQKGEPQFRATFELQPLVKVHLYSKLLDDVDGQGDIAYVRIFSIVAIFILLVACINFMNLATARSAKRAREVGIRKVIGARRYQLAGQFLGESMMVTFLSLLVSIGLVIVILPTFNQLLGKHLTLRYSESWLIVGLILVFLMTSFVAGSYPALFLSAFRPVKVLKDEAVRPGSAGLFLRNGLVIFQFVISIVLIASTIVVYSQLRFIRTRNLGYDKEDLLYFPLKGSMNDNIEPLTAELKNSPSLSNYSIVSELPINESNSTSGIMWEGKDPKTFPWFALLGVDENFLDVFKMQLVSGRGFSTTFGSDSLNYVVNEQTVHLMGLTDIAAVGKSLNVLGMNGRIIGVVKNFNFKPVQSSIEPLILQFNSGPKKASLRGDVVVRVRPESISTSIKDIKTIWRKHTHEYDLDYGFVDQELARQYLSEQRMSFLFDFFAALAIWISCLGLIGLAAFTAERRTKEIGIRKALGASVVRIMTMLSRDLVRLVILGIIIGCPIAYFFMHQWLNGFAFRINLSFWIFALAGLTAIAVTMLTISIQILKAARANPVTSLRSE